MKRAVVFGAVVCCAGALAWKASAVSAGPPSTIERHTSPAEALGRIDMRTLNGATRSIDMAAYLLSDWGVILALTAAGARGVQVRVVLDGSELRMNKPLADLMRAPGVAVRIRRSDAKTITHLKAYLVDGALMRTGSANFSLHGLTTQANDLLLVRDEGIAAQFRGEFDALWADAEARS